MNLNLYLKHIYSEAKVASIFKLLEKKPWTQEEKDTIKNLVNKNKQRAEQLSIDWGDKDINYSWILSQLATESKTQVKKEMKQGLSGLTEGKDYLEIPLPDKDIKAYIPLSYKASRVIASDRVGKCEGKWCTAYQKDDVHWDSYINQGGGALVYIVNNGKSDRPQDYKHAIFFIPSYPGSRDINQYEIFDAVDNPLKSPNNTYYFRTIQKYVESNWKKIRKGINPNELKIPEELYWMMFGEVIKGEKALNKFIEIVEENKLTPLGIKSAIGGRFVFRTKSQYEEESDFNNFSFALKLDGEKLAKSYTIIKNPGDEYYTINSNDPIPYISIFIKEVLIPKYYKEEIDKIVEVRKWDEKKLKIYSFSKIRYI